MDLGLTDKVAIITGGSEGVGKGVAVCLAREGAKVAICARRQEVLEQAAQHMREQTESGQYAPKANSNTVWMNKPKMMPR